MTRRFFGIGLAVVLMMPFSVAAHRMPVVVSTVKVTGTAMQITHRFHVHDGIRLLTEFEGVTEPDLGDMANLAKLALYAEENFVTQHDGAPHPLTTIGAEQDGAYVFVYQEGTVPASGTLKLKSTILKSLGKDWLAHVNIEQNGKISTLVFTGRGKWQKIN
ncbi:MAG: DUF6702 family protein [Parvularculaceae bacterium]